MFIAPKLANFIVAPVDAEPDTRTPADFVCNGENDTEQLEAALNKLPSKGGKIYITEGTLNLTRQVTRDIDNVTIEGGGAATRINFNGSTPVISAGSRAGWSLINFDTDAGGVDVDSATESVANYWKEKVRITAAAPGEIMSNPPSGSHRIKNIFVTADGKLQIDYEEEPV